LARARRYREPLTSAPFTIRTARPTDVRASHTLVDPFVRRRLLVATELIGYYEAVQEFLVAVDAEGGVIGCGALHVLWEDLGEVRTLAVHPDRRRQGVGRALLASLLGRPGELGLRRLFCLTFEVTFFGQSGFVPIEGTPVDPEVFSEMLRSHDEGVAQFLDLARMKPNTLGNTRMLLELS